MSRLALLQAVRGVVEANVPAGFVPARHYAGLECWAVPADRAPRGRERSPLVVVGLGERKSYVALFLMGLYFSPEMRSWFDSAWRASGSPLQRGKIAVQLRDLDDVPLDVVADAVAWLSVDDLIAAYERDRS